jgi:hypothetical protein
MFIKGQEGKLIVRLPGIISVMDICLARVDDRTLLKIILGLWLEKVRK